VLFPVDAGFNNGFISNDPVEQRVRKAPEEGPADVPAHEGEREWRPRDQFNRSVNFGTELTAEPPALALVLLVGCLDATVAAARKTTSTESYLNRF